MTAVDLLLTAKEVAAMLRISVPTLYREIQRGRLPRPLKLGSCSRWPQGEIWAAIRRRSAVEHLPASPDKC
ncbi:helix-turn-helix transcriptional regulator [Chelativorans composti]|uniref:Helix-turn-helix transcriptional regulator n=1 Tax=Chelativorans composti TaxID=768533 RepID=A0ABW5DJ35_9HYPH